MDLMGLVTHLNTRGIQSSDKLSICIDTWRSVEHWVVDVVLDVVVRYVDHHVCCCIVRHVVRGTRSTP